jgi:transposase
MVTVGLDLHKRYITACALNEGGTTLTEHRRLEPSLDALGRWLGGLPQPVLVVMEATLCWHWLVRQLMERGFDVLVAHPYQVKLIWQARTKTDPIDARKLAELARAKLLPAIWIPDPATRALRQLLRGPQLSFGVRWRFLLIP